MTPDYGNTIGDAVVPCSQQPQGGPAATTGIQKIGGDTGRESDPPGDPLHMVWISGVVAGAEEAQSRLHRIAVGSFFFSRVSHEAFHLLFLNPPYHHLAKPVKLFASKLVDRNISKVVAEDTGDVSGDPVGNCIQSTGVGPPVGSFPQHRKTPDAQSLR